MIRGLNHITFAVADLEASIAFYRDCLGAKLLMKGQRTAYFDLAGLWLALNLKEDRLPRPETYTHLAFTVDPKDLPAFQARLRPFLVDGRIRSGAEGQSLYFKDPDGHLFELHTSCRQARIEYYQRTRSDMEFFVGGNSNE